MLSPIQHGIWAGAGGVTDPYFSNVVALLHFNGSDTSTTFTDETGKVWTANGDAQLDTAQKQFGTASGLFDGTGDYLTTPDDIGFDVGSSDFTLEVSLRQSSLATGNIFSKRASGAVFAGIVLYVQSGGEIGALATFNGSSWGVNLLSSAVLNTDTWEHIAFVRSGNSWTVYHEGTSVASTTASGTVPNNTASASIAGVSNGNFTLACWLDEFRLTKGTARYTTNFTPPTEEFPNS